MWCGSRHQRISDDDRGQKQLKEIPGLPLRSLPTTGLKEQQKQTMQDLVKRINTVQLGPRATLSTRTETGDGIRQVAAPSDAACQTKHSLEQNVSQFISIPTCTCTAAELQYNLSIPVAS